MPVRAKTQRRGAGKPRFLAPSHRWAGKVSYRSYDDQEKNGEVQGRIVSIINDPGRTSPLMIIKYGSQKTLQCAVEGSYVGMKVQTGVKAEIKNANVIPLEKIPEGTRICNIELKPGDGGKLIRSAGSSAKILSHEEGKVFVQLPSKKVKILNPKCRAMIGRIAGAGFKEKPLLKAGKNFYARRRRGKYWPVVSGTAMNAFEHPQGGGGSSGHKQKAVKRTASLKLGSIAPSRTGRRKRK